MDIKEEIKKLKKEKNALILAHYYQRDEIQAIADIRGDSLALAQEASKTDADIIVFCGVKFMAETAKIISPDKKVLIPVYDAGCPLAGMATAQDVSKRKKELNNPVVVSYVNTTAEVKSVSDICCTSGNAVNVVRSLKEDRILFVPDRNLGSYVKEQVTEKEVYLWDGYCLVHEAFNIKDLKSLLSQHPDAKVAVHPESPKDIRDSADFVGSTAGIIKYVEQNDNKEFIIGTEEGLLFEMKQNKKNRHKKFYVIGTHAICKNMKKTHIENLRDALKFEQYEIKLNEDIVRKARQPIEKMVSIKRG